MRCKYHVSVEMVETRETGPADVGDDNRDEDFRRRIALRCPIVIDGKQCLSVGIKYDEDKALTLLCYRCKEVRVNTAGNLCTACQRGYRIERLKRYQAMLKLERASSRPRAASV